MLLDCRGTQASYSLREKCAASGKAAIRKSFEGTMSGMRSFGYTIVNYCESEDGRCAAVKTATHHVLKQGMKRDFPQVFIFEVANEHITRLQAYEPYGLHGILGAFLSLPGLASRFVNG